MAKRKRANAHGMRPDGGGVKRHSYVRVPHQLFYYDGYLNLSIAQKALLFDLYSQFKGDNNGNLCLTPSFADDYRWSRGTVKNNRSALVDSGLIRVVGRKPLNNYTFMCLYAVNWLPVNDCNQWIDREELKKRVKLDWL